MDARAGRSRSRGSRQVRPGLDGCARRGRSRSRRSRYNRDVAANHVLDGVRAQLARVSAVPWGPERDAPWPGAIVVGAGLLIGLAAWLGARAMLALGVAPAIAGITAIALGVGAGAAVIERGLAAAFDRWTGPRWSPFATGGSLVLRVIALWSTAPAAWLAALVIPAGLGRLAAIGLQRLGDVRAAPDGRSLVVGMPGLLELAVATAALVVFASLAAGGLGAAAVGAGLVIAIVLGLSLQLGEGTLAADSLAVVAAAVEIVGAVGFAAIDPATRSPFVP